MTEDGLTHSAAFDPWAVDEGRRLILRARRVRPDLLRSCSDHIDQIFRDINSRCEAQLTYSDEEAAWERVFLPDAQITALSELVRFDPADMEELISDVPLRWQQDAAYFLESVIDEALEPSWYFLKKQLMWRIKTLRS